MINLILSVIIFVIDIGFTILSFRDLWKSRDRKLFVAVVGLAAIIVLLNVWASVSAYQSEKEREARISQLLEQSSGQGKTIEFLRDIAPLPERKLLEVRNVIETNLSIRLNLHYGWWFYDQRKELLKYTFTDSARTNFAGAAYVRRDILESVIRESNDPIVISNLFNWICHKPIKELSGKSGILLQQDEIEIISDLIDTMLVVMSLGYDRANSSHYLKFKFFSGYDRSGAHIWKDAWLTREEVEKLSCCSIYIASMRLYEMLKSKGIDAQRFKAGGWTDYCINI